MSKMRTGWVIKRSDGAYLRNDPQWGFEPTGDIDEAYVWEDKDRIGKVFPSETVVKVEWQPRMVKEEG